MEFLMEDVGQKAPAVVPDGVIFWVLVEKGACLLEGGVGEVFGCDL